jgi:hypothetical protein
MLTTADKAETEEQTYLLFPLKGKTLNQFKIGVFPPSNTLSLSFSKITHTNKERGKHTHTQRVREIARERMRMREREGGRQIEKGERK